MRGSAVKFRLGEQIDRAAHGPDVPGEEIDEAVRSLSEHMGWDITKGSGG